MFIETWTAAQPRFESAHLLAAAILIVPQAGTGLSLIDNSGVEGNEPSSGYSLISSKPIAVTSTLNA